MTNNQKVRGSSPRGASMLFTLIGHPSCLSRGSHSSAGQSVRLITARSAVQARVGPCTCHANAMDSVHSVSTCVQLTLHQPNVADLDSGRPGGSNPGSPHVEGTSDHRAMRRFSALWCRARFCNRGHKVRTPRVEPWATKCARRQSNSGHKHGRLV